jgi:hypothetical protein
MSEVLSFLSRIKYGVDSSGNPDAVPAKAGYHIIKKLDSCLSRNDKNTVNINIRY